MRFVNSWIVSAEMLFAIVRAAPGSAAPLAQVDCALTKQSISLKNRTIIFPATGAITIESHLATTEDRFPQNRLFAVEKHERLDSHQARSCQKLLELPIGAICADAYKDPQVQEWTPPEHGLFGQGSVGDRRPTVLEEMWSGNMYWTAHSKPKPGTRFLVTHGRKHIVLVMGYETGPTDPAHLLGVQSEVAYYLGLENDHVVKVGRLVDQSASPGPVECASATGRTTAIP